MSASVYNVPLYRWMCAWDEWLCFTVFSFLTLSVGQNYGQVVGKSPAMYYCRDKQGCRKWHDWYGHGMITLESKWYKVGGANASFANSNCTTPATFLSWWQRIPGIPLPATHFETLRGQELDIRAYYMTNLGKWILWRGHKPLRGTPSTSATCPRR